MPALNLNGIEVNFPYEPYPCQVDYMKCVLDSITQRKNAILESPTGTGKTLCLLCSSISWLLAAKADMQLDVVKNEMELQNEDTSNLFKSNLVNKSNVNDQPENANRRVCYPKIIYASRTHSQLTQVIKELKMTQYNNIKTCAIGSRDQLCINPQVNQQKSYTTKLNMCKAKVNAKTCYFHNNLEFVMHELKNMLTVDIEDLNAFGNKHKCCPYYTARSLKETADILFMPYNYLLDKKLRKSNNIEMNNTVVIFDEAHNVERVCEDSASGELSATELASAMSEINYLLEEMKSQVENNDYPAFRDTDPADSDDFSMDNAGSNSLASMPASLDELKTILTLLKAIEDELDAIKIPPNQDGLTKPAMFLFEMLNKCGISFDKKPYVFDILNRLLTYFGAQIPNPRHHNGASLGKFLDFLQTVFSENMISEDGSGDVRRKIAKICQYYKVHVKQDNMKGRTLYFWCLCPGYSMQDLLAEGARCIILTSGTLSPISTFKEDMKIPFDIILENPHIIKETQIKVLSLSKGPDNTILSSKYTNRDSENYMQSLGQLIVDFCQVVPHGVLVFFPSYRALDSTTDYWRKNNIWKLIGDSKCIFMESKGAKECNDTVSKYYERINDRKYNGAIMFAVCRGKISEGIDFADNNGRAVIITGLPFPLYTDPRVILKRQYLDENKCSSGSLWYNQQTYRAINQAIGRVIRHKNDYGAIMLCDERFCQASTISQLPGWMRAHVKKVTEFRNAIVDLSRFFNIAVENFPVQLHKNPGSNLMSRSLQTSTNLARSTSNAGRLEQKEDINKFINSYYSGGCQSNGCSNGGSSSSCASSGSNLASFYEVIDNQTHDSRPTEMISSQISANDSDETSFKLLLHKRKVEEVKNPKCRVVIKDTIRVEETKSAKLQDSKSLLLKINSKLNKDEYQQFKVALSNFHAAKKTSDNEKKIKYYKILRSLFANDLEFFKEIENFIQFNGTVKVANKPAASSTQMPSSSASFTPTPTKRKLDECD